MKRFLSLILTFAVASLLTGCGESTPPKHYDTEQDCMNRGDVSQKATCLVKLAKMKYEAGASRMASDLLSKALVYSDEIADASEKSTLLNEIAEVYGLLKDSFGQTNALNKARDAISKLEDPDQKSKSLIAMAQAQASGKNFTDAFETAKQACSMIQDNFLPDDKANILLTSAQIYHDGGDPDQFEAAITKVRELADGLTKDAQKAAELYGRIGITYYATDVKDKGKEAFDKAKSIAKGTKDLEMKGFGLIIVAELAIKAGDKEIAKSFLEEAQKVVTPLTKKVSDRGAALDEECNRIKGLLE